MRKNNYMGYQSKNRGNIVVGTLILGLVIWGITSLFQSDNSNDYNSSSGSTYKDSYNTYDEDSNNEEVDLTFKGYACTDDCSGHEAGYNWAEEKGISDENDCGGNSNSFIEGCVSFVEENY